MDLSIIIPALNEQKKIIADVQAAVDFLQSEKLHGEVIVVVDGSSDDSFELVKSFSQTSEQVSVLPYSAQRGKGAAIKRGVENAIGAIIMFADSGMCVPYADAKHGLTLLGSSSCDLAIGSRAEPGTVLLKTQPRWRQIGSTAFRFVIQTVMGIPRNIGDTQCGFKLYRSDVARHLFGSLFTPGYMFDIEIILRALKVGYRIRSFPVHWSNDEDSRYKPVTGSIAVLRALLEIRFRLLMENSQVTPEQTDRVTVAGAPRGD